MICKNLTSDVLGTHKDFNRIVKRPGRRAEGVCVRAVNQECPVILLTAFYSIMSLKCVFTEMKENQFNFKISNINNKERPSACLCVVPHHWSGTLNPLQVFNFSFGIFFASFSVGTGLYLLFLEEICPCSRI